jgi:hypothetical protein
MPAHDWNGLHVVSMLQSAAAASVHVDASPSVPCVARHIPQTEPGAKLVASWHAA